MSPESAPDSREGGERVWPHLLAVSLCALAVYAITTPRTVALEDDGSFIMAVHYWSVAHPPGYPLFVLLAKPFTWLPLGSVALRVHLASSVFGAGACAVLWWTVFALLRRRACAYGAALTFAFSPAFWSQSIIAEVYTLNVLLFLGLLALCLATVRAPTTPRIAALGLLYVASLSNHWPFVVLATPCLALALWPARGQIVRRIPAAAAAGLLGLVPYAWMMIRSQSDPVVSFYGPIESLRELASYIARRGYWGTDPSLGSSWVRAIPISGFVAREILTQFTPAGALLAGVGAVAQWRRWGATLSLGLLVGFLGASFGLAALLRPDAELLTRALFRVYPLLPYAIMAIWLALGLERVSQAIAARAPLRAGPAAAVLASALVAGALVLGFPDNDRRSYTYARDYAEAVLKSLPTGAPLFTTGDPDTLAIGYLHLVEGVRPDVALYNDKGLVFRNRLFPPLTSDTEKRRALRRFVEDHPGPVYFVGEPPETFAIEDRGFYKKVDRSRRSGRRRFRVDPDLLSLFRRILDHREESDLWTVWHRNAAIRVFTPLLAYRVHRYPDDAMVDLYRAELERASEHFPGLLERIRVSLPDGGVDRASLLEWARRAEELLDGTQSRRDRALLNELTGRILLDLRRVEEAHAALERSVAIDPVPENGAVVKLLELHAAAGEGEAYRRLRSRVYGLGPVPAEVWKLDRAIGTGDPP
jgi:hypothetical protein